MSLNGTAERNECNRDRNGCHTEVDVSRRRLENATNPQCVPNIKIPSFTLLTAETLCVKLLTDPVVPPRQNTRPSQLNNPRTNVLGTGIVPASLRFATFEIKAPTELGGGTIKEWWV